MMMKRQGIATWKAVPGQAVEMTWTWLGAGKMVVALGRRAVPDPLTLLSPSCQVEESVTQQPQESLVAEFLRYGLAGSGIVPCGLEIWVA